ncbi:MAG: DUF488 domain-containing protein [Candidatus Thiodiazotropha sp. (ex Epidulcina cf. delphinae)]|nr:DUF488 domain-containing protein [Candidatus Thiodiazotropha sp. (ex Epidulcina cf. delphinae)]
MDMKSRYSLFNRQKVLVALLHALGGKISNLDFQKLLLLYCREIEVEPSYEFVPYKFGAFSFTSYADRRRLMERGLLADDDDAWVLTDAGCEIAEGITADSGAVYDFARQYQDLRGNELIADTYRRYPWYGINSQIADKVLRSDAKTVKKIKAARPAKSKPGLTTIGYEGRTLEAYLNILLKDGVTVLCDVRRNALSRKYGFSKGTLSKSCEGVGIRYEHLPELGIDSRLRKDLSTQESYDRLFGQYERDILPNQSDVLATIADWVEQGERVALTCYEHIPGQCHRHCVSEALEQSLGNKYIAKHL